MKSIGLLVCLTFLLSSCATMPGNSRTSLLLAKDTQPLVIMAAKTQSSKDCQSFQIINTAVVGSPTLTRWSEVWTVNACGKKIPVPVTFVSDGIGGTNMLVNMPVNKYPSTEHR